MPTNSPSMTKPVPSEFRNPTDSSQRLVIEEELLKRAGISGSLAVNDFKDGRVATVAPDNGIVASSSISVVTFNGANEFTEEKFTSDGITSDTLFSATA